MPESAEVALTADTLAFYLGGKSLVNLEFVSGKYTRTPLEGYRDFLKKLPLRIDDVCCKGKLMMILLGDVTLFSSFGMTGSYRFTNGDHTSFILYLDDGTEVYYNDPRQFGNLSFTFTLSERKRRLSKLATSVYEIRYNEFRDKLKRSKGPVAKVLMDQGKVTAGIGNYQLSEVLYDCMMSPLRDVKTLTEEETERLFSSVKRIPLLAYLGGGVTLRDYISPSGDHGDYVCRIYGREYTADNERVIKIKGPHGRSCFVTERQLG